MSTANDQYLQNMVFTASPAKLRLLLLERAVVLVEAIKENRMRKPHVLVDEKTITLRDILGELLSGVKRAEDKLAATVADLYVFLLKELTYAEQEPGIDRIDTLGHILEIERETWRQVCDNQTRKAVPPPAMMTGTYGSLPSATMPVKSLNFNA